MAAPILLSLLFVIPLLIMLITSIRSRSRSRTPPQKHHAPPSPPKLPILGNLHQLGSLPHRSLQSLSIKHGPIMLLHLGKIPTIIISSSELAQEILKTSDVVFASRPSSYAAHHLVYGGNDMVFSPYGSYWRQARKICILELLSSRRVQSFKPVREEEVGNMIKEISSSCSSCSSVEQVINLSDMLMSLSGNIISRVALGKTYRLGGENNRIGYLAKEIGELLGGFYVSDYFPSLGWIDAVSGKKWRLGRNFRDWDDFLDQVIEEKIGTMNYDDQEQINNFVCILLQVQRDSGTDDVKLTKDNVKAILLVSLSLPAYIKNSLFLSLSCICLLPLCMPVLCICN